MLSLGQHLASTMPAPTLLYEAGLWQKCRLFPPSGRQLLQAWLLAAAHEQVWEKSAGLCLSSEATS